jgi:Arc/MetJ-type ribon-helix-helix transcriptional regulator
MKKKILIGIPERLLDQIDLLADCRSQTRSELIREALRTHLERTQSFSVPATPPPLSVIGGQRKDDTALAAVMN